MPMHMQCLSVVVGVDGVVLWWLGGWSDRDRRPSLSSDHRCRVVFRCVSFGGRLQIREAHAMRKVPPVLMQMHDA